MASVRQNPWLVLVRPANLVTSAADALAGMALAGAFGPPTLQHLALVGASVSLYAGGIVYNDVCDAEIDAVERPERPIPSGQVSRRTAALYGAGWLGLGIGLAAFVSWTSALLATGVAVAALTYDRFAKPHPVFGPLVMGICRGLNLLVGVSLVPEALASVAPVAVLPVAFVAAITLTSRGEVHGNNRGSILAAMALDAFIVVGFVVLHAVGVLKGTAAWWFVAGWAWANASAKWRAYQDNQPANIMAAVRTGVLSLIPLDAAYVAGAAGLLPGLLVLSLLPLSLWLGQRFRVT
ncbi:MAG: UbiA-like protein EboC [Myxococcota bacterium]